MHGTRTMSSLRQNKMDIIVIGLAVLLLNSNNPSPALAFHTVRRHRSPPSPSSSSLAATAPSSSCQTHNPPILPTTTTDAESASSSRLLLERVDETIVNPFLLTNQRDPSSSSFIVHPANILANVEGDHERDVRYARASPLPFEFDEIGGSCGRRGVADVDDGNRVRYEAVRNNGATVASNGDDPSPAIAIRTHPSTPLLNEEELATLRRAVQSYWDRHAATTTSVEGGYGGGGGGEEKSRFTYQRRGNSEAHLSDVVRHAMSSSSSSSSHYSVEAEEEEEDTTVSRLVSDLLTRRVYPWVRDAYLSREEGRAVADDLELYVYDSLFIRYNATEAAYSSSPSSSDDDGENPETRRVLVGAGQPLHRDLGYVSVNVMLNSQEEFRGGGTFFEEQLRSARVRGCELVVDDEYDGNGNDEEDSRRRPLKPLGPGHALAHFSRDRHSGAATVEGLRDILVIFLATAAKGEEARASHSSNDGDVPPGTSGAAPPWEINARLKSASRGYCGERGITGVRDQLLCRVLHNRLAVEHVHDDGEAWHYLGMALSDYRDYLLSHPPSAASFDDPAATYEATVEDAGHALDLAVSCLEEAARHTPCDARLHNNLGITLERSLERAIAAGDVDSATRLSDRIEASYRTSVAIHSACERAGCDVAADYEGACLNYGLYLSKRDEFAAAADVLTRISPPPSSTDGPEDGMELDAKTIARRRVARDAMGLLSFCQRQMK